MKFYVGLKYYAFNPNEYISLFASKNADKQTERESKN